MNIKRVYFLIMNICLFSPDELNKALPKHDERTEHIVKVLHKKVGDSFDAGIIGGQSGIATITRIIPKGEENAGALSFTFEPTGEGKPLYPLILIVGFPRPIQLRRLLRDAAGLGSCQVHLTGTELGEKSYMDSTLVESGSAYKMLLDGTAQAASTHVPELIMHKSLKECLESLPEQATRIALDNINPAMSLGDYLKKNENAPQPYVAAIGSERGWTDRERDLLERKGFIRCGMGQRILRTETAVTVAGALILDAMGKLS